MRNNPLRALNLMTGGQVGGIETLCYNWGEICTISEWLCFFDREGNCL